jgi:hypothetical protein
MAAEQLFSPFFSDSLSNELDARTTISGAAVGRNHDAVTRSEFDWDSQQNLGRDFALGFPHASQAAADFGHD